MTSKNKQKQATPDPRAEQGAPTKYPKPKILLLDLPESASTALLAKGFNLSTGTLGSPYSVGKASSYLPLIGLGDVPNSTEQEIVVVDLAYDHLDNGPRGEKHRPDAEPDLWGKCDRGFLDPRVRTSIQVRDSFDRTLSVGGVFIVFADARTGIKVQIARAGYNGLYDGRECPEDVYHFLSELSDLQVGSGRGEELRAADTQSSLGRLLAEFLPGSRFSCTVEGGYRSEDEWKVLAENKFREPVAICRCRAGKGSTIVFPQLADKPAFLSKLFTEVLPEIAPHLFPHIEKGKWTHLPEYELARVAQLKAKQAEILHRAEAEVAKLEAEIASERASNGWIHDLLTGTDVELVAAVKKALEKVGFASVTDVDAERDRQGKSRREDLQVQDQSPLLIIDVKGIGAFPSDEDALQAEKHAAIRMRELKRTDIVGLSIVNHQRHMPPLERESKMPFRQELLDAAEERTLGLMTAWDLYRLVRNFGRLGWQSEHVRAVFYKKGRIDPVPTHYQYIGTVAKAWTDKFGVLLQQGELHVGDQLAVEFPIEFEQVPVNSIRVQDKDVKHAKSGDPAGILWPVGKPKLKEGMRVFRIPAGA